jgi:asparagine synthase (glutamine-hydrolysing)
MPGLVAIISKRSGENRDWASTLAVMFEAMSANSRELAVPQLNAGRSVAFGAAGKTLPSNAARDPKAPTILLCGEIYSLDQPSSGASTNEDVIGFLEQLVRSGEFQSLAKLNGLFSGILYNQETGALSLFVDRYSSYRLYVCENDDAFYFASEAKALLAVLPAAREFNLQSLGEWLSCGAVLQNRTLFKNITVFPAGSVWTFRDGSVERCKYFSSSEWTQQPLLSMADYESQLCAFFDRGLKRYVTSDVAISLTGGLDGRMIMAWLPKTRSKIPCYTFGGEYRECADVRLARRVAQRAGCSHQTLTVGDRFFDDFPNLARDCVKASDGTMDVSGAAEIYANRLAFAVAPIRLTGNYGSEILRRNIAFRPSKETPSLFNEEVRESVRHAAETFGNEARMNDLQFVVDKQLPWHHHSRASVERSQLQVRSPFLDNELVRLAFQAPLEAYQTVDSSMRIISRGNPDMAQIPTDRGVSLPISRRTRATRFYHELLARAEYAYDYGMPDWLARFDSFFRSLHVERLFLGRQKFCHFRVWYRDRLAGYVKELLLDPLTLSRPWWSRDQLTQVVREHTQGLRNHTLLLHKTISIELIARHLLQQNG